MFGLENNDILKQSYGNINDWKNKGFDQNVNTNAVKIFNENYKRYCPVVKKKSKNRRTLPQNPWLTTGLMISRQTKEKLLKFRETQKSPNLILPSTKRQSIAVSPSKLKVVSTIRESKEQTQKVYLSGRNELHTTGTIKLKRKRH